jgi:glycine C-acetyltransferase
VNRANEIFAAELDAIRQAGTWKTERRIASTQGSSVVVDGKTYLNFCSNNYLGLANHPAIVASAKAALDTRGYGVSSVRFICGTQDGHAELEAAVSRFLGTADTILYGSCFDANGGVFEALLNDSDVIISDELNHASIIDGVRLAKAQRRRYAHRDMGALERELQATQSSRLRLVVTDGVFSMDGDYAPLDDIVALARTYDAMVMVDDSHATGFVGPSGRGTAERFGVLADIDIITSTFGKALGGASGGFVSASSEIINLLRQRSRPYLFSNALPPAVVAASMTALELVDRDPGRPAQLMANALRLRHDLVAAGFTVAGHEHPIIPIMLGDAGVASTFAERLKERGMFLVAFSYPVVPKGQARIRLQLSALHTSEEIDRVLAAIIDVGRELGVLAS